MNININSFSITFWFNPYSNYKEMLSPLQDTFKSEFSNYNLRADNPTNLFIPIINAINKDLKTRLLISQINCQYFMDKVTFNDFADFKEKILTLYDNLTAVGVEILYSSVYIDANIVEKNSLSKITKNILSKKLCSSDLIDVALTFSKKHEDLFYKIINVLNKKQIKIDQNEINLPLPLISLTNSVIEKELIEIQYEINDKYSFDYTKKYHTTDFYLNKMLYILEQDFASDVTNLLEKGEL